MEYYILMDISFLPQRFSAALNKSRLDMLYELRLRCNQPVKARVGNKLTYLADDGFSLFSESALHCTLNDIQEIIKVVTEYSEYAHTNKIIRGYLSYSNGIRIGLAGECVYDGDKIVTIKNVTSLNLRFPHDVDGCTDSFYKKIHNDKTVFNTLIVSPPFCGKTTMLKDVSKKLNNANIGNILLIDERGEFDNVTGENIDKIKFCDKFYGFNYGLRSLSPKIVVTDELSTVEDWMCAKSAANSGVKIIASCHARSLSDLSAKEFFDKNIFERYVVLSCDDKMGTIASVCNGDFCEI